MLTKSKFEDDYRDFATRHDNGRFVPVNTPEEKKLLNALDKMVSCLTDHFEHLNDLIQNNSDIPVTDRDVSRHQDDPEMISEALRDGVEILAHDERITIAQIETKDFHLFSGRALKDDVTPNVTTDNYEVTIKSSDWDREVKYRLYIHEDTLSGSMVYDFFEDWYTPLKGVDPRVEKVSRAGVRRSVYSVKAVPDIGYYLLKESGCGYENMRTTRPISVRVMLQKLRQIPLAAEDKLNKLVFPHDGTRAIEYYFM